MEGVDAALLDVSPDAELPQLATAKAIADRVAPRIDFVMLAGTPSPTFCADIGGIPVAGVDEAGRGPLAGPVVAAAVVLCKPRPAGLDDSKKLTAKRRSELEEHIRRRCAFGIGVVGVEEIDRLNIFGATMLAMTLAMQRLCHALGVDCSEALIDGNLTPHGRNADWRWPARAIVGGDGREPAIGAASILAKTCRDRLMVDAAKDHPHYGWERNKGYGSKEHIEALHRHGPTPLHRRSFAPVAQLELL